MPNREGQELALPEPAPPGGRTHVGILMAGRAASVTLFSSSALCPQDSAWHVEEDSEEEKRATGLLTAQIQVRWASAFFLKG